MLVPIFFFLKIPVYLFVIYQGDTTTGSGIGTDNQYPAGHHHHHHVLGHHRDGKEVTGSGDNLEPSMTDKVVGGAKKVAGKVTSNNDMYQQGKQRAVSWLSLSVHCVLNICFEYQGWLQGWLDCRKELLSRLFLRNLAKKKEKENILYLYLPSIYMTISNFSPLPIFIHK